MTKAQPKERIRKKKRNSLLSSVSEGSLGSNFSNSYNVLNYPREVAKHFPGRRERIMRNHFKKLKGLIEEFSDQDVSLHFCIC